jgi:hypothetical protein
MTEQPDEQTTPELDLDDTDLDPRTREAFRKLRSENRSLRARLHEREDRLHEREEQIGAAAAREAVHHRAVVEAAAKAAGLIDGSDIWSAHPDPTEFLDEFADVVPDRVAEATRALFEAKPYLARPVGAPPTERPIEGLRSGARPEEPAAKPAWAGAIKGTGG